MAGSKPRKSGKADKGRASRESRKRAGAQQPTEWFGSAVHAVAGLMHLDVRAAGNGLLLTASPAESGDRSAAWQLRLRNNDGGQSLRELAAAFRAGTAYQLGAGDRYYAFFPAPHQPGIGSLVNARFGPDPEAAPEILCRADRPLALWAEAGTAMEGIIADLDTTLPPERWEQEEALVCPGCLRPVYDSTQFSGMFIGAGMPIAGLCQFCVSGETLHTVREAGLVLPEQQRAVLEAMAGA
ncbi:hypothetical protein OG689_41295 [Kitasatospora sp. NBC_00240]|uniref:hypothetical protein n=1 Tax=Kitasatospora sp. NBC_00240 TaxID=2903567 RepID=UPI002258F76E|nr:hypothetical protein [Kitasatospora sp. NBC_00240]MCX5215592.1 hypothetical protein [Kitasatospora sp. NBC_00240]